MVTFEGNVIVTAAGQPRIQLNAGPDQAVLGGAGQAGGLTLLSAEGRGVIGLSAGGGNLKIGGRGVGGNIMLFPRQADDTRTVAQATIHISGQTGDIELLNADAAEDFDVVSGQSPQPGDVMVLDDEGLLQLSQRPYDRRVAGVVAGAGGYRPGIVLGRDPSRRARVPIALVGRVVCKAQAADQPIAVGDLLTTSALPGYAMRATDHNRAFGAVLGKAMGRLEAGRGLVPVIVTLR
jgi:hypothetical protein